MTLKALGSTYPNLTNFNATIGGDTNQPNISNFSATVQQ